jgi:hypothetical protein
MKVESAVQITFHVDLWLRDAFRHPARPAIARDANPRTPSKIETTPITFVITGPQAMHSMPPGVIMSAPMMMIQAQASAAVSPMLRMVASCQFVQSSGPTTGPRRP